MPPRPTYLLAPDTRTPAMLASELLPRRAGTLHDARDKGGDAAQVPEHPGGSSAEVTS